VLVLCANFAVHGYTAPDGSWTKLSFTDPEYADAVSITAFAKIADSEGASWTFTQSTEAWYSWAAFAYSGVDTAAPIDVYSTAAPYVTEDTTVRAASVTVTAANCLAVWLGSWINDVGGESAGDPSGFAERLDYQGTNHSVWVGDKTFGAGATGNVDLTVTSATTMKDACMVALKPAADAPEAPTINAYQSGSNIIVAWS